MSYFLKNNHVRNPTLFLLVYMYGSLTWCANTESMQRPCSARTSSSGRCAIHVNDRETGDEPCLPYGF